MSLDQVRDKILVIADQTLKYSRDLKIPSTEVFVYNLYSTNLTDNKGKVDSRDGLSQGVGIRASDGKKIGFASTTGFDEVSLKSTLNLAHSIAKTSPENPMFNGFVAETKTSKEGILDNNIPNLDAKDMIEHCNLMEQGFDSGDNRLISVTYAVDVSWGGYALGTSEGCLASSLITTYGANSFVVVTEAGDRKTAGDFVQGREIKPPVGLAANAMKHGLESLGSKAFGGSEVLPTVWKSREAAPFIGFPFINNLSGTGYVEKSNPWKDKLGEQVCVEDFTLVDEGQNPEYGACRSIDTEGTPKQTTTTIENGILKTFLFNKMYGEAAKQKSTGNAQRGFGFGGGIPFENLPAVGPNQLLVKNVGKNLDEQIAEIDKGVLITGTPIGLFTANPVTGDFSITTNDAFLIEKGEIVNPLKSISIAGNYFKTFKNIVAIGSDREASGWPLDAPSMTFKGHTISD
ncbi:MAG: TldD/PmbA family protein [Candidatus Heimdallarchaeota archaeon]|nr:TldD/PmbA family protein [Candidatus Heimdallarchaeota archaeon]